MDTNEKNNGMEQTAGEVVNETAEAVAETAEQNAAPAVEEAAGITAEQAQALLEEDSSADDKGLNKFMAILGIIILILAIPASYYTAHVMNAKDFFDVTPEEFCETYGKSLPDGFTMSEELVNNPYINNFLQLSILSADGTDNGCAVMFASLDPAQPCDNVALVTGNSLKPEEFEALAEWYLELAAPDADKGFAKSCAEVYASKSMGYDGLTLKDREVSFIYQPDAIMNNGIIAVAKIAAGAEGEVEVSEGGQAA